MSVDKLVDSTQLNTDLTAVADAIRSKGGTSAPLAFPQGFVDAIEAIETGGSVAFTYDKTITTNGGRDTAHSILLGLLPYREFSAEGYIYKTGITSAKKYRIDYGTSTDQAFPDSHFKVNADGDTTTLTKITGALDNGSFRYKYFYDNVQCVNNAINRVYDGFAFHWLSDVSEDSAIVVHFVVTAST